MASNSKRILNQGKLDKLIEEFMDKFNDEASLAQKKILKKTHDPFLFAIDFNFIGSNFDWKPLAVSQAVKQNRTNAIGDLHEKLVGLMPGWKVMPHQDRLPDLVNKRRKILIEIKSRADTTKGADLPVIYDSLLLNIQKSQYKGFTGFYAFVLNKTRKSLSSPEMFTPSDSKAKFNKALDSKGKPYAKRRPENSQILQVDGKTLWSIITDINGSIYPPYSNPNAIFEVYEQVIETILKYGGKKMDSRSLDQLMILSKGNFNIK